MVAPRDSRFFLKDYVKRLEIGDASDTRKKDVEIRRKELFEYSKKFLKDFLSKEMAKLLYDGPCGILIGDILDKLEAEGNDLIKEIAKLVVAKPYEGSNESSTATAKGKKTSSSKDENDHKEGEEAEKSHYIEDPISHFLIKQIFKKDQERAKKSLTSKQKYKINIICF